MFDARAARLTAEIGANLANPANPSPKISRISKFSTEDRLDRFDELSAMLEFEDDMDRPDAEARAAGAVGAPSPATLFAELVWQWRAVLRDQDMGGPMPTPGRALIDDGIAALEAGWAFRALEAGWRTAELWETEHGLFARLQGASIVDLDAYLARLSDARQILKPVIDGRCWMGALLADRPQPKRL